MDRPALFPPTFLYTQSWEDPAPDMEVSVYVWVDTQMHVRAYVLTGQ